MFEFSRRNALKAGIGLAAASVSATSVPASAAETENPMLIALAGELPAILEAYFRAHDAYDEMQLRHKTGTPLAPDEITEIGIGCPQTTSQLGEVETYSTLGYLYRKGEKYPRRIVRNSWQVYQEISDLRRVRRRAKREGDVSEFLRAEEEFARLKKLEATIHAYEEAHHEARAAAHADHERLYPLRERALQALADHVSAIMSEADWTMEGLIIKAETLMEWNKLDKQQRLYAHIMGADWHASIASSILRHADGGASRSPAQKTNRRTA